MPNLPLAELARAGAAGVAILVVFSVWRLANKDKDSKPGPIYALLSAGIVMVLILFWPSISPTEKPQKLDLTGELTNIAEAQDAVSTLEAAWKKANEYTMGARDNSSNAGGCSNNARTALGYLGTISTSSTEIKVRLQAEKSQIESLASK